MRSMLESTHRPKGCGPGKKDISISGSEQAVRHYGVLSPYDYEKQKKIREALRDLEKTVIMGILSGNTIGTSTARRTMSGIRQQIATNVRSVGPTLTESWLGTAIQDAWTQGGTDVNLLYCGVNYKRIIDGFNGSRKLISNDDTRFKQQVTTYESTFGMVNVMLSRWMPANELLVLATNRISVRPLRTRSFQAEVIGKKGDSMQGFVIGLELAL